MDKKKYLIIGVTILLFIIAILIILFTKDQNTFKKEILNSEEYSIKMSDCNNREVEFPKETIKEIINKMDNISDNGPWTGNAEECHNKVTVTYSKGAIVNTLEILLVDTNSLVLNISNKSTYYTNSEKLNSYLNDLFSAY